MKEYRLEDPLYGAEIFLLVGGTLADLRARAKEKEELQENCPGYCLRGSEAYDGTFFVWVESPQMPLVCHELLHLTFWVLGDRGLSVTDESDEAYTYWFENMLEQVMKLGLLK